jgi:hypothetical protein
MKSNKRASFVCSSSTSFAIIFLLSDVLRIGTTCRGFSIVHRSSDPLVGRIPRILQPHRFQSRKRRRSSVGGTFPHFISRQGNEYEPEYKNSKDGDDKVASAAAAAAAQQREEQYHSILEYSIDSFLRGEYDRPFAEDAAAPLPGLTPQETVETALESLRRLDDPEPSHGAAVLLRFCAPLSRADRWGASSFLPQQPLNKNKKRQSPAGGAAAQQQPPRQSDDWPVESSSSSRDDDNNDSGSRQLPINSYSWKEVLRGALTPTMLARRIRASQDFSGLLDWTKLDLTEGAHSEDPDRIIGVPSNVAFVNATLYFEKGDEPMLIQFTLRRMNGVWLIDSAQRSDQQLFQLSSQEGGEDDKYDGDW